MSDGFRSTSPLLQRHKILVNYEARVPKEEMASSDIILLLQGSLILYHALFLVLGSL